MNWGVRKNPWFTLPHWTHRCPIRVWSRRHSIFFISANCKVPSWWPIKNTSPKKKRPFGWYKISRFPANVQLNLIVKSIQNITRLVPFSDYIQIHNIQNHGFHLQQHMAIGFLATTFIFEGSSGVGGWETCDQKWIKASNPASTSTRKV